MTEKRNPYEGQHIDESEEAKGISNYKKWFAEERPEITERNGKKYIKIYRGLEIPDKKTVSGSYYERQPDEIDLTHPGTDWTPILKFADVYGNPNYYKRWCVISAFVPLDNQTILSATIDDQKMLGEEDWGDYKDRPVQSLTDSLMIVVPASCYGVLEEIKIEKCEGEFKVK